MFDRNTKTIILSAEGIMLILIAFTVTMPYFQNVTAFPFQSELHKLFGGLFHKPLQHQQTAPPQSTQTLQNSNNTSITAPLQSSSSSSSSSSSTIPIGCHVVNGDLPDPKCTPGMINPSITQENIKYTICVSGFTKTIRPPVSYTAPLKIRLMHSYGFTDSRSNYELDHLVPLEIGGNPSGVANLWPEPGYGQYNFHVKDRFENYLHNAVCSDQMNLSEAQHEIATDWVTYWKKVGQP
jgi:hypothetical protein